MGVDDSKAKDFFHVTIQRSESRKLQESARSMLQTKTSQHMLARLIGKFSTSLASGA